MQAALLATRLQRELRMLHTDPPPGVCAWPCNDSLSHLEAQIQGPDETVYAKGIFKLEVRVPERYPFEPPNVKFRTPIYHPNIDSGGRICLDILNMPPKGAWKPSLNIPTILASIGLLLAEPNPDDGLMGDITAEYKHDRASFDEQAKKWTDQYAVQDWLEDSHQIRESQVDAGEQETPTTERIDTAPPNRDSHIYAFGLGISEERAQEMPRVSKGSPEKQPSAGKSENVGGPVSTNQKLNLSKKLSRGKGAKVLEKESTADITTEASQQTFCIDNTHATRPTSAQQDQIKLANGPSSIKMVLPRLTAGEPANVVSGASSSTPDTSLQSGNVVNTGNTENSPRSPCVDKAEAIRQVPFRFNKLSGATAIDLTKFRRPKDKASISTSGIVEQQIMVNPEVPSIFNGSTESPDSCFEKKAKTVGENGRHKPIQASFCSSKLSRPENGARRPEAENLSQGMSKNLIEKNADSILKAASSWSPAKTVARPHSIQKAQNQKPPKIFKADNSQASSRQSNVESGPLHREVVHMDAQKLSSNPSKRFIDEPSKESLGQLGVHLSRDMGKRTSGNESITTATAGILNKQAEISDRIQEAPSHLATVTSNGTTAAKVARLEEQNHKRGPSKITTENSTTTASPQSTSILKRKVTSMDVINEAGVHVSSIRETSCTANQNKVSPPLTYGPSKVIRQEIAEAPVQAKNSSTGTGEKTGLTKKALQINPADLIVLDSESDEEPPKGRSRLSLANRKGTKRR